MISFWLETNAYQTMVDAGANEDPFVLHDGPPYANGHIHLGTAMNKILKDIIVKSKNLQGLRAEYIPGWDCHGLPIEHKVEQELKKSKEHLSTLEVRKRCRQYATKYLEIQREEFKRLGVLGKWESPYLTMRPEYEAATARELANFMDKGSVFRHKKPIYWCTSCETALAEAEVEYGDHTSPSIYVRFPLEDERFKEDFQCPKGHPVSIIIWTTTPWTIPGNMAVAVHPDFTYVLVQVDSSCYILAEDLLSHCVSTFQWTQYDVLQRFPGRKLEHYQASHPLYPRNSLLVLADYVTLETGTGCVHTAPGHGQEDYETCLKYGLEVYCPVNANGLFNDDLPYFGGVHVFKANAQVIEKLDELSCLVAKKQITHSYPHCWRCKKPVIFRATTQWFISMDNNSLRAKALEAIDNKVTWIPSWGQLRIRNMVAQRPDWCISRQRSWGVPIIALLCQHCSQAYCDPEWVRSVVDKIATHPNGADYWFETPVAELIPANLTCPHCGRQEWNKETDILDVWFDSGTSFAAVLEQRDECTFPSDMYLEGSDQHRGWFHSSLLASIGTREMAPYRSVLTHGFVVDGNGRKMSKSQGNVVAPQDIIKKYGAEILRMWVASENYQEDLRISEDILKQLVDYYRRIRNTCRFILGNLYDFDPAHDSLPYSRLLPLDRYAMSIVADKCQLMHKAYDTYELHKVYHSLHNLCVNDLSAFYLDILKDRLYVSGPKSEERRSAQTALSFILTRLLRAMAPILSFTAEEVYQHLPQAMQQPVSSVFALHLPEIEEPLLSDDEKQHWDLLTTIRTEVTKAIEPARKQGIVGHSLNSAVVLYAGEQIMEPLHCAQDTLREFFIVSQVALKPLSSAPEGTYQSDEISDLYIEVAHASGEKCPRCWTFSEELGQDPSQTLCPRCQSVLRG
jgi:isoleucyl-tRNA synthetase